MALTPGSRVGPYEIQGLLGVGGMGEVYRARDVKLDRDVAIKILPEAFASDPERTARFQREAKTLAALSHPHIGGIYGLEEAGGATALVLEFVDGPTLADWIADRSSRSSRAHLEDVVSIARQITEALEAAHGQGIVHRDLKPANIKLGPDGSVKVLDFGLAKALETAPASSSMSMSPTLTSPLHTGVGMVLGTAAYMSPEQARGRAADKRADIWAFGCVLFEMLTGKRPFEGTPSKVVAGASAESQADNVADTLAAVLRSDPDWSALPGGTPASIRRLLRRALAKDRKERLADIADARLELDEALQSREAEVTSATPAIASRSRWPWIVSAAACAILIGVLALIAGMRWSASNAKTPISTQFTITPGPDQAIGSPAGNNLVLSPDGSTVVYTSQNRGLLYMRRLGELEIKPIAGTENASQPFFSPDSAQLGFIVGGKIQRLLLTGGVPIPVCNVNAVSGLAWGDDGFIVFAGEKGPVADDSEPGLFRVTATGGKPERLTTPAADYSLQRWPHLLPGGRAVVFTEYTVGATFDQARVVVRDLDTGRQKTVAQPASDGRYVRTGHILYATNTNTVMAVAFDARTLTISGNPFAVQDGVSVRFGGIMHASVSDDGVLVFWDSGIVTPDRQLVWRTRDGSQTAPAVSGSLPFARYARLSPDGKQIVATLGRSGAGALWVYDVTGGSQPRKLTFAGHSIYPSWTGDGKRILFDSDQDGRRTLYLLPSDGSTVTPEKVVEDVLLGDISPDGHVVFVPTQQDPRNGSELWYLDLNGDRKPQLWFASPFSENEPRFSHDGRWVAYVSDQNGKPDVWVRPFPGPGTPVRVSSDGGHDPVWSRDGKELFFQQADGPKLFSAEIISTTPELRFGRPRVLFQGGFVGWVTNVGSTFDVGVDGRFLMTQQAGADIPPHFVVVTNWFDELKRLAPVK